MEVFCENCENQSIVKLIRKSHWKVVFFSFFDGIFINIKFFYHLFLLPIFIPNALPQLNANTARATMR